MEKTKNDIWRALENSWPSPMIARSEIGRFTGGLLAPATLRNLDSKGVGITPRLKCGRKTVYAVKS